MFAAQIGRGTKSAYCGPCRYAPCLVVSLAALPWLCVQPAAGDEAAPASARAAGSSRDGGQSAASLAADASNPNAPLTQLQIRNITAPRLPGFDGTGNTFELEAIVPVKPSKFVPFPMIMKLTVPVVTLPDPVGQTAFGPTQFFAQAVFTESWGSWGLGLSLVAPTETFSRLPKQEWQLGPAAAVIFTGIPNLVFGGVFQNPITVTSASKQSQSNVVRLSRVNERR